MRPYPYTCRDRRMVAEVHKAAGSTQHCTVTGVMNSGCRIEVLRWRNCEPRGLGVALGQAMPAMGYRIPEPEGQYPQATRTATWLDRRVATPCSLRASGMSVADGSAEPPEECVRPVFIAELTSAMMSLPAVAANASIFLMLAACRRAVQTSLRH